MRNLVFEEKENYLYHTGQDFDEQGEIEQALQHYVHAIEYFLAAARCKLFSFRNN